MSGCRAFVHVYRQEKELRRQIKQLDICLVPKFILVSYFAMIALNLDRRTYQKERMRLLLERSSQIGFDLESGWIGPSSPPAVRGSPLRDDVVGRCCLRLTAKFPGRALSLGAWLLGTDTFKSMSSCA